MSERMVLSDKIVLKSAQEIKREPVRVMLT